MRFLRGLCAIPFFLVATVLFVVAGLLCVTILLLPLGVPLGYVAMRFYTKGMKMLLPRRRRTKRHGLHKVTRRRSMPAKRIKRVRKDARKRVRRARKTLHV